MLLGGRVGDPDEFVELRECDALSGAGLECVELELKECALRVEQVGEAVCSGAERGEGGLDGFGCFGDEGLVVEFGASLCIGVVEVGLDDASDQVVLGGLSLIGKGESVGDRFLNLRVVLVAPDREVDAECEEERVVPAFWDARVVRIVGEDRLDTNRQFGLARVLGDFRA